MATMSKEPLRANIDADLKREATEVFASYGLTMTGAITMFLRQSVIEGGIPFKPVDPFYSPSNLRALDSAIAELDAGRGKEHELIEVEGA